MSIWNYIKEFIAFKFIYNLLFGDDKSDNDSSQPHDSSTYDCHCDDDFADDFDRELDDELDDELDRELDDELYSDIDDELEDLFL